MCNSFSHTVQDGALKERISKAEKDDDMNVARDHPQDSEKLTYSNLTGLAFFED